MRLTSFRFRATFLSIAAAATACGTLLDVGEEAQPTRDAGSEAAADVSAPPPPSDAGGADADAGPTCARNPIVDPLLTLTAPFQATGATTFTPEGVMLTPEQNAVFGGLWWNEPRLFDAFKITFEVRITGGGGSAEGMGVAWLNTTTIPAMTGDGGTRFGLCGQPGTAVVFDARAGLQNLRIVDTSTCNPVSSTSLPAQIFGTTWRPVTVELAGQTVSVRWNGETSARISVGGREVYTGLFGFGATTGLASSEAHWIRNVRADFPSMPPCP